MSCNNCYNPSCDSTCGCPQQVKGTCVFYQGANLDCLDVTKGDTYDSILANLNTIVCNLQAPSGIQTTLTGCSSITVTQTSATNYNVCLSSATQTQINNNTTNISTLSACVANGVLDITSSTLDITEVDTDACGRTLNIEIPTPSGVPVLDGIIYNNVDKSTYLNTTSNKTLKTHTGNYISVYNLQANDEIRFRATGQVLGDGSLADDVIIQLYDSSSSSVIDTQSIRGFDLVNKQSWIANASITVIDESAGTGLYQLEFFSNSLDNGLMAVPNSNSRFLINKDLSAVDFDNLTINIIYNHVSTTPDTNNFARQLMVEVRKYI